MEEALKLCRSVQNLLVLISGTLLAFALSVGETAPYQRALNDLLALGEDGPADLSKFITSKWIVERRSETEILPIYQASNETLKNFAVALRESMNALDVHIDYEKVFDNTIFSDGTIVRLGGWERPDLFLDLPPVEAPTVRQMLQYLEKDGLEGTILVLPTYADWLYPHIGRAVRQKSVELKGAKLVSVRLVSQDIGKGRIDKIERRPGQETPFALFRFNLENSSSNNEPLIELDVEVPMNRTSFNVANEDWINLQRSWYVSRGLNPDGYVLAKSHFLDLRTFMSDIQNMSLRDAADWLRAKLVDEKELVTLSGISVSRNLISTAGPIVLIVLMIGLISTIHHIAAVSENVEFKHYDFPWGVISPSPVSKFVSLASISIVPGGTCVVLQFFLGGTATTWGLGILGAVTAIAVFLKAQNLPSKLRSVE